MSQDLITIYADYFVQETDPVKSRKVAIKILNNQKSTVTPSDNRVISSLLTASFMFVLSIVFDTVLIK